MLSIFQAVILGLAQGLTELFPISSLGHSVIIPGLLGWHINQNAPYFLTFLVATHFATAAALLLFFWRDWLEIVKGVARSVAAREVAPDDAYAKLGWLLIIATIPAGLLGLALQKHINNLFASARIAAFFLIINGVILFMAERLRRHSVRRRRESGDAQLARLTYRQSLAIGLAQSLALIPGISRSGTSMAGGLLFGLNNESAARFSFLLATPVIGAAALLKLPELFDPSSAHVRTAIVVGALCAAGAAFLSTRYLVRYFETKTLKPFATYCVVAGILFSAILAFK
jgi:undecaprenyl-diphosphatase